MRGEPGVAQPRRRHPAEDAAEQVAVDVVEDGAGQVELRHAGRRVGQHQDLPQQVVPHDGGEAGPGQPDTAVAGLAAVELEPGPELDSVSAAGHAAAGAGAAGHVGHLVVDESVKRFPEHLAENGQILRADIILFRFS